MTHRLSVYVGFDPAESVAFHVLVASILRQTRFPVTITPLVQDELRAAGLYTRERLPTESTAFSHTRFLVPYLAGYAGLALYLDCDFLVRGDLSELIVEPFRQPEAAVLVCQHDYVPKESTKMGGRPQLAYPRKNWGSFILFVNDRCRMLTPEYVNTASPAELHQFAWVPDAQIGALPLTWNWLIGEYPRNDAAQAYHYTLGIPALPGYETCDHADLWWQEYREMLTPCQG